MRHGNHGAMLLEQFKDVVQQGRKLRLQSFNNYRLLFGMSKYESFMELTGGDVVMSQELEKLYGHIDALEFYPGMLLEKSDSSVTPFTMVNIGGPYAVKGMMSNPISSPHYWKASTFGGQIGFDIVKTTTIRDLFCRNMKPGECGHISFKLPDNNNNNNNDKMNNNAADDHIVLEPSSPAVQSSIIHSQSSLSSTKTFSPAAGRMTSTPQFTANYRSLTVDDLDFIECHQPTTAGQRSKHQQHSNNYCNLREVYAL